MAGADWQSWAVGAIGLAAVLHLARRWWPWRAKASGGVASGACGGCSQGCHSPAPEVHRAPACQAHEQPVQMKTRS